MIGCILQSSPDWAVFYADHPLAFIICVVGWVWANVILTIVLFLYVISTIREKKEYTHWEQKLGRKNTARN